MAFRNRAGLFVVAICMVSALAALSATSAPALPLGSPLAQTPPTASEQAAAEAWGLSAEKTREALFAQGRIAATGIVTKIESALGADFGGVWLDPAAATLRVGVTSPAAGATVAALVAREAPTVTATTTLVDFGWAQLEAIQERWNRRLAPLFSTADVETALDPELDAVKVILSSAADPVEGGVVQLDAAASGGAVVVEHSAMPHLRLTRSANKTTCKKWVKDAARCDKPITAGVTIQEEDGDKCTAGPLALSVPNDHETFLLTAGHCIYGGGGIDSVWFAYNRAGEKEEIGKAIAYLDNKEADIGVIRVKDPGYWTVAGNPPAYPVYAKLSSPTEPFESIPVNGRLDPVVNDTNCGEGEDTGEFCGKIKNLDVTVQGTEHLTEDEGAFTNSGDSGGPWVSTNAMVAGVNREGTTDGSIGGKNGVYEPLSTGFKKLNELKKLPLELLTTVNEKRPVYNYFTSAEENTWLRGDQATQNVFTFATGTAKCTTATFEGGPFEKPEQTSVTLHPTYSGCTAFGALATIVTTGCNYVLAASGTTKIECETGKSIKVTVTAGGCSVTIGTQTPTGKLDYSTAGSGSAMDVLATSTLEGIKYTSSGGLCGASGEKGKYTGTITTKGYADAAHTQQVGIKWEKE